MTGTDPTAAPERPTRCGFVAIVGAPNAGKSTLLNRLVGHKVSIVSPKVQTTRRRIIGITTRDDAQILFVDTPGIFPPRRNLEKAMVRAAWEGVQDADLAVVVVDSRKGLDSAARHVIEGLRERKIPAFLVLNKLDLVEPPRTLPLIAQANELLPFERTFIVSALGGSGCGDILDAVAARIPQGPWLFPADQLSDLTDRALAAEITREQIFLRLREELPYAVTVETEAWTESKDGKEVRIDQVIYVQRDGQKAILIGKGGQQLKAIGTSAREELERLFQVRVHLFLFVKVRPDWPDDPERYAELGLDFPR